MKDNDQIKWEMDQLGGKKEVHEWYEAERNGMKNLQMPVPSSFGNWLDDKMSDIFGKTPKR